MIEYKVFCRDKWDKFIEKYTKNGLKFDSDFDLPLSKSIASCYEVTTTDIEKLTENFIEHSNARQYFEERLGDVVSGVHLLEFLMTLIFASCVGVFFYERRIIPKPGLKKDR